MMLRERNKLIRAKNKNQCKFNHSWLLILALNFVVFISGIACSTTQKEQIVSDIPESHMQEIEETRGDFIAKIALLAFENYSEDKHAPEMVMPLLKKRLESMGFLVLDEDALEGFLVKERIRATGYVSSEVAKKMKKELDVEAILVGSINTFYREKNPSIGLSARLINSSDGSIVWTNHVAATGEDYTGILGLGTIKSMEKLAVKMTKKLLDSFNMVPPYKEKESTYKIAVMPFKNKSKIWGAGMIATYSFIVELFKSKKFEPLSYGDVRRLIVELRVRSKGELDFKNAGALAESLRIDGILVGAVENYTEEKDIVPPIALISARLIDARTGRIVWYDGFQYRGDDGISIFDWGRLRSAESVAYKVVSKLVKDMSKAKWE